MNSFSIRKAFSFGWDKVLGNLGFFVPFSLIVLVVSFVTSAFEALLADMPMDLVMEIIVEIVLLLLSYAVSLIIAMWAIRVSVDAADGREMSYRKKIIPSWEVVWKFALSNIMLYVVVGFPMLLGFITLSVPFFLSLISGQGVLTGELLGTAAPIYILIFFVLVAASVYLSIRLYFSPYLVVDKKLGPINSFRNSWRMTRGSFWKLLGLSIALGLLIFAGLALLVVGLLVALPVALVASGYVYRRLEGEYVPTPSGDSVPESDLQVPTPTL